MTQREITAATVQPFARMQPRSAGSELIRRNVLRPSQSQILGKFIRDPVAPRALMAAEVFPELRQLLPRLSPRTTLSRAGEVTLTFSRGQRHAVLTADADGELVLLLTDRGSPDEPEAEVVGFDHDALATRIRSFLER